MRLVSFTAGSSSEGAHRTGVLLPLVGAAQGTHTHVCDLTAAFETYLDYALSAQCETDDFVAVDCEGSIQPPESGTPQPETFFRDPLDAATLEALS